VRPGFSFSRFALAYIALGVVALVLFAVALWDGYRANLGAFRAYVPGAEMQRLADIFHRDGAQAVAAAVDAYLPSLPADEVLVFADREKRRLAGNLPAWPAEVPDVPGTYGLVIGLGGDASMRVVTSHVALPGGYSILMGRESVRFHSLVQRFWYGIVGAMALVLALGALIALRSRRVLVAQEQRFTLAVAGANDGIWDWNLASGMIYISPRGQEILTGRASDGIDVRHADDWARYYRLHPDDALRREAAVREHFQGRTPYYEGEWRVLHADGSYHWVHSRGLCTRDASGRAVRFAGSTTDIDARKRAEEALRESEKRYERVMQAGEDGFWEWVAATDEFYASPRMLALYGLPLDTVFRGRKDFLSRFPFHPEDLALWRNALAVHLAGQSARVDIEVRVKLQSTTRWMHLTAICLRDASGAEERWTGSVSDVTARKRAEDALRESEERYARAMEATEAGHWEWDLVGHQVFQSPRFRELYGVSPEEKFADREAWKARQPVSRAERERQERALQAAIADPTKRYDMELSFEVRPGEVRWLRSRGKVFRDEEGRPLRVTGATTDITAHKLAQEALRLSEERYALAMEAAGDGHTDWNLVTGEFYISPRLLEILGYASGTTFADRADWVRRFPFHPEDRPKWEAAVAAHFAGREAKFKRDWRIVVRGQTRWVAFTFIATRVASGKPVRWTGSIADINDAKLAEDALRESQERYALAVDGSNDGIWDWDLLTNKMFVSERAQRIFGLEPGPTERLREEWHAMIGFHPVDHAAQRRMVEDYLSGTRNSNEGEWRLQDKDGGYRWIRIRSICLRNAAGEPVRMAGSVSDIDAQKKAEEALRLSEERYAYAMEAAQDAHWDWIIGTDKYYTSPRVVEVFGLPPGTTFTSREDYLAKTPLVKEDLDAWLRAARELFAGTGSRLSMDLRAIINGEVRWIQHNGLCVRDASGRAVRWCGSVRDVTERRRAEEALRLSEERYALAMEASEEGHFDWNVPTDEMFASAHLKRVLDLPADREYRTRSDMVAQTLYYPGDRERLLEMTRHVLTGSALQNEFEYRLLRGAAREPRWIRARWKILRDAAGVAQRVIGVVSDITERKLAAEELRESEQRFRALTELSSDAYWAQDEDLRFVPTGWKHEVAGYPSDSSVGKKRWELSNATALSTTWAEHEAVLRAQKPFRDFEYRRVGLDGTVRYVSISGTPIFDEQGAFRGYQGVGRDITDRKRAEQEVRESEARFRALTELSSDWYWEQDENLRFTYLSNQAAQLTGYSGESSLGKTRWEIANMEPLSCSWEEHQQMLSARQPFRDLECRRVGPDGTVRYLAMSGAPIFDAQGRFRGYRGIGRNITERKRVEEALRQSEERYALAVSGSNEGIFDWDLVSDRVYVSYRAQELFGLPRGELWRPRRDWRHILAFHSDDARKLHDSIKAHIEGGSPTYDVEFRIVVPGGGVRWYRQRGIALRDATGKAYRVVGSIGDVTEKHIVEEELGSLERRLRQAQRLEAMGTLAGGIAHDFNNILGAILGYGEMAMRDAPKGSRLARDLDSIVVAGERGRALVDRVLAFSRSAVGERVTVHVEKVVREALDLISAKLPPDVTLHAKLHGGRAALLGDATQVHQVVTNLATNAIQAMPAGGTLRVTLRAARLETPRTPTLGIMPAGDYLIFEVADSGTGIAPEILDRIFDPFFTTKEVGTGTGLGLSLVHGIVIELGGAIDVASAPGKGSTFTVYLPRSGDALDSSRKEEPELPRGDGQRVLVVDDEEPLVKLATRTLEELGYAPVGFTSSAAALAAFRADPQRFDAVLTDERMPGMSGSALIREVRGIRDRIPVVLMSGFVSGVAATRAREAGAEEVLKKPLSARDLAASLARVLQP
jgi:PAS domain S-box-containing protein